MDINIRIVTLFKIKTICFAETIFKRVSSQSVKRLITLLKKKIDKKIDRNYLIQKISPMAPAKAFCDEHIKADI